MALTKNTEHVQQALANFVEQFKGKINLNKLMEIYIEQVQEVENMFDELLKLVYDIDAAFGAQLDILGDIVGEERFGRDDLQYRTAIKARIILNGSEGTPETIIALVLALQPGLTVEILEFFPAEFLVNIPTAIDPTVVDINQIASIIKAGKPAAVAAQVEFGVAGSKQFDTAGAGFDLGKFAVVLEAC